MCKRKAFAVVKILVIIIIIATFLSICYTITGLPIKKNESRIIPWPHFSPDGKTIAYIYRNRTYEYPTLLASRPLTMTDSLQVRWFQIGSPKDEKSISLDSIDLRPEGKTYYNLDGELCFSPDSQNLAAICAKYIAIIDVTTGDYHKFHYYGEWFGSLRWLSEQEIVFSTEYNQKEVFWRLNINNDKNNRVEIYEEKRNFDTSDSLPPSLLAHRLANYSFSPNAKYVLFTVSNNDKLALKLLNLETSKTKIFHINPHEISWKLDGSQVLINDRGDEQKICLIKTETGEITDLTAEFIRGIDKELPITLVAPLWTLDGKYVIIYSTEEIPKQSGGFKGKYTGYLIQPVPFKVILTSDGIIRWSPHPGWVFRQGKGYSEWINYSGTRTAKIDGSPHKWTWSRDRIHAAKIEDGKVVIFKPTLPSPTKNSIH
ncbi:MAG: hypothetical protein ACYS9Y_09715 [Planctomycetota bacterium]|jgi:Tol biopolymer transport system component